jgi:dipeptidyl aminopeptidase/acylaminoacyl peptidase
MPDTAPGQLLDWKARFRQPDILWSSIAPLAPGIGLVGAFIDGPCNLWAWDVPSGRLRALRTQPGGRLWGTLAADGRHVFYLQDTDGNEIGHYVAEPLDGGPLIDLTPDLAPYSSPIGEFAVSDASDRMAFIVADEGVYRLYVSDRSGEGFGPPRLVLESPSLLLMPLLSADGRLVACASSERSSSMSYSLVVADADSGERRAELWDGEGTSLEPATFAHRAGDGRLLVTANRSGAIRPALWDALGGARVDLDVGGLEGDVVPIDISPDGDHVLVCHIHRAEQRLYLLPTTGGEPVALEHPPGAISYRRSGCYFTPDGAEIVVRHASASAPGRLGRIGLPGGSWEPALAAESDGPPNLPLRSIGFRSSDGAEVQGWLGVPPGSGPFPTVLETHGGPHSVDVNDWRPDRQAWLDRGFAYLSINYRGSTTFGKEFQEQIWGRPGHWELEDMAAARAWLIDNDIARPDLIFLTGWSYGGYLTLLALGRQPDLWAGGMAGIAIGDWRITYEDSSEFMRGVCSALFKGTPDELPSQYAESSPTTYADAVRAPVLIIQGRGDSRTPARSVEAYEARLRDLGKPIEMEWFDSGHLGAFTDTDQLIRHYDRMLEFGTGILARARP